MKSLLILYFFVLSMPSFGQILPPNRSVNWKTALEAGNFSYSGTEVNIHDYQSKNSDTDDAAFASAQASLQGEAGIIYFPNGEYIFTKPLILNDGLVLRGESTDSVQLIFDLEEEDHLIIIAGSGPVFTGSLQANAFKGDFYLEVSDASFFQIDDYVKVSDDDSDKIFSSWALNSTGQISRITSIEGNRIKLESALRRNYSGTSGKLTKVDMMEEAGVENLSLERSNPGSRQNSNILFYYAANSIVKCVNSSLTDFAHVEISHSTRIKVSGSYFHDAFDFGGGGKAYGVLVQFSSGENLIEDNIFSTLRHSMIVQAGANGNVFAYNYSVDPYWTGVSLPSNSAGDMVLHGNYSYANLFEGNVVQNLVIDNSHGTNGPLNTFFRNRLELFGIVMNAGAGNGQNFMGNEVTNKTFLKGNMVLSGTDHFLYANYKGGVLLHGGDPDLLQASLYLQSKPDKYEESSWPPIGNVFNAHKISAQERYASGLFTACSSLEETPGVINSTEEPETSVDQMLIYPNPTTTLVNIQLGENDLNPTGIRIFAINGKTMLQTAFQSQLNIQSLATGVYFLEVSLQDGRKLVQKMVKY